jgi:hypothetical protein
MPELRQQGKNAMKKIIAIVFISIVSFAIVVAHDFNRASASADGSGGIPLAIFAGNFTSVVQGSITSCFDSNTGDPTDCSTAGAASFYANLAQVGQGTRDQYGNTCQTSTSTLGYPGFTGAPSVTVIEDVGKVTNYDPATGSGDVSFTSYTGGKCNGSKFNGTHATVLSTGTAHFVGSSDGKRVDAVTATLTNSQGSIGAFNILGAFLKQ